MNPFAWDGPLFLVFYAALALAIVAYFWVRTRGGGAEPGVRLSEMTADPYRIACLRNGDGEAIRIAIFNLLDRGLLHFNGMMLTVTREDSAGLVRRPLDAAILAACRSPKRRDELMAHPQVRAAARAYPRELIAKGLFAHEGEERARARLLFTAWAVLGAVAGVKIAMALSRAQTRIGLLVVLLAVAVFLVYKVLAHPITPQGARVMRDLRALAKRLRDRVKSLASGGKTNDATLAAAVYGLDILPYSEFPFLAGLFPRRTRNSEGDSNFSVEITGCGSSGDSSGCSSGCGGGCGGCGSD